MSQVFIRGRANTVLGTSWSVLDRLEEKFYEITLNP